MAQLYLALVPGIGSLASDWIPTMPSFVGLVPVDYEPSAAYMNISALTAARWQPGRQPGGPGDAIEVAALRLLLASLQLAGAGEPWAIAGHSTGGPVVYRCMELMADLFEWPSVAAMNIRASANTWLPHSEAAHLASILENLAGSAPSMPVAAISLEGSLLPCDVAGWAKALANPDSAFARAQAGSSWERTKESTLAAVCLERCTESPPRHLHSIKRWLQIRHGPPFVYIAGTNSYARTSIVFPALRQLLNDSGSPTSKLEIVRVPGSGHVMYNDAPDEVRVKLDHLLAAAIYPELLRNQMPDGGASLHALIAAMGVATFAVACAALYRRIHVASFGADHSNSSPLLREF